VIIFPVTCQAARTAFGVWDVAADGDAFPSAVALGMLLGIEVGEAPAIGVRCPTPATDVDLAPRAEREQQPAADSTATNRWCGTYRPPPCLNTAWKRRRGKRYIPVDGDQLAVRSPIAWTIEASSGIYSS
jgi:hypothetical protein